MLNWRMHSTLRLRSALDNRTEGNERSVGSNPTGGLSKPNTFLSRNRRVEGPRTPSVFERASAEAGSGSRNRKETKDEAAWGTAICRDSVLCGRSSRRHRARPARRASGRVRRSSAAAQDQAAWECVKLQICDFFRVRFPEIRPRVPSGTVPDDFRSLSLFSTYGWRLWQAMLEI